MPVTPDFTAAEAALLRAGPVRLRLGPHDSLPNTRTLSIGGDLHLLPVYLPGPGADADLFPTEEEYSVNGYEHLHITFLRVPTTTGADYANGDLRAIPAPAACQRPSLCARATGDLLLRPNPWFRTLSATNYKRSSRPTTAADTAGGCVT